MELDVYYDEEPKFRTPNYRLPVMIKSPEDLSDISGYNFVINSINALDARLYDGNFPMNGYHDLYVKQRLTVRKYADGKPRLRFL